MRVNRSLVESTVILSSSRSLFWEAEKARRKIGTASRKELECMRSELLFQTILFKRSFSLIMKESIRYPSDFISAFFEVDAMLADGMHNLVHERRMDDYLVMDLKFFLVAIQDLENFLCRFVKGMGEI
ncbi:hypothetical protein [Listeria booriae]|uniref:hypothetical protein n=1 Tax=Listeria booriae TaxID=1552123 RepID=UPI0016294E25|nr:hypothetical protein [Listeria booriae]MBC2193673.1 hypothetical protein [Listeria booriae]